MASSRAIAGLSFTGGIHRPGSSEFSDLEKRLPPIIGADFDPVGLVRPRNAEQLAGAVREARSGGLGILRLYSSSNVGARLQGDGPSLVVDLSQMKGILEVNDRFGYARIEPGVTFVQLSTYLESNGHQLLVDAERDPAASILASSFAKGIGFTPYADHALMQCGGEFVLPDGSLVRTGMGAMPDNRAWQLYKYALGPYSDGLAIQSDLMIPAQAGIWLMGQVPVIEGLAMDLEATSDVAAAMDIIRPFKHANVLAGTVHFSSKAYDTAHDEAAGRSAGWRMTTAFYGMPKVVELNSGAVRQALSEIPGGSFPGQASLAGDRGWHGRLALMSGRPARMPSRARMASLSFAAPLESASANRMLEVVEASAGDGASILTEFAVPARALLLTTHFPYRSAEELTDQAQAARSLIQAMTKAGFGLIAESVEFQKLATDTIDQSVIDGVNKRMLNAF